MPIRLADAVSEGTLSRATVADRARWTDRTIVEFGLLLGAILGPALTSFLLAKGGEGVLASPLASLVSAILVILILVVFKSHGSAAFQNPPLAAWGESLFAAPVALVVAIGWVALMQTILPSLVEDDAASLSSKMGLPLALFVVAVVPAFVEEVAFRGFLQGRLTALYGNRVGAIGSGALFALCHFAPLVLPIHLGLGLYLAWLRQRSGSVLPGMVTHLCYNALVVFYDNI